jgi:hypothetical protein
VSNEQAAILLFVLWLVTGRGLNLCLVILLYYFTYIVLRSLTVHEPAVYYGAQMALDTLIIACCCQISSFHKISNIIALTYALIIFTSLMCEGLKLVDEIGRFYVFNWLHELRQSVSMPVDIVFAIVGSAWGGGLLDRFGLYTRAGSAYTSRQSITKRL